jgi:hypothetical protein
MCVITALGKNLNTCNVKGSNYLFELIANLSKKMYLKANKEGYVPALE